MTLRHLIVTVFILTPFLSFSQRTNIEEKAMDYYIKNIHDKGDKLKSTGQIEIEKVPNYVGHVISNYFVCKRRQVRNDTAQVKLYYNEYMRLGTTATGELDTLDLKSLTVKLKNPIKKVERLEFQKLRGGFAGLCRRMTNKMFGEPFNVYFFRHIGFEGHYYTRIDIIKKDGEYGRQLWFKLNDSGEVLDWCEDGWIQ
jgi:hypothetical protein